MKKIFILFFILSIYFIQFNIFGAEVVYNTQVYENKMWDLETGAFIDEVGFYATSKIPLKTNTIYVNNLVFHHLIIFGAYNSYLGYYNTIYSNVEINPYFIDTIDEVSSSYGYEIVLPEEVYSVAFVSKSGNPLQAVIENPVFNNKTYEEVFIDNNLLGVNGTFNEPEYYYGYPFYTLSTSSQSYLPFSTSTETGVIVQTNSSTSGQPMHFFTKNTNPFNTSDTIYFITRWKWERNGSTSSTSSARLININSSVQTLVFSPPADTWIISEYKGLINSTTNNQSGFGLLNPSTSSTNIGKRLYLDFMLLINLTDLGISSASITQSALLTEFANFESLYFGGEYSSVDVSYLFTLYPSYDNNIVQEEVTPDNYLDNILSVIGFENGFAKLLLSLVILVATGFLLITNGFGNSVVIAVEMLVFIGLSYLGWVEIWFSIILVFAIVMIYVIKLRGNGGGDVNEEN